MPLSFSFFPIALFASALICTSQVWASDEKEESTQAPIVIDTPIDAIELNASDSSEANPSPTPTPLSEQTVNSTSALQTENTIDASDNAPTDTPTEATKTEDKASDVTPTSSKPKQKLAEIDQQLSETDPKAVSWLELMDALAQFKDNKKLDAYIDEYYQQNPDISSGKFPNLAYDAAITGNHNFLQYLIDYHPESLLLPYQGGPTVLGYVAGDNQTEIVHQLLKAGIKPDDPGNTQTDYPLYLAINSGNLQMITLLMDYGASVHIGKAFHSPLTLILDNNDLEVLRIIDAYSFTLDPLDSELRNVIATYLNSELVEEEVLKVLVKHGFDPFLSSSTHKSFVEEMKPEIKSLDVLDMLIDVANTHKSTQISTTDTDDEGNSASSNSVTTE